MKIHIGRSYANFVPSNTLRTINADLEESRSWIEEAIKNSDTIEFGVLIAVTYIQPKILLEDSLSKKSETASFKCISRINNWDNDSLDEHKKLVELFLDKNLIPQKVLK